jgi:hypothetical protein
MIPKLQAVGDNAEGIASGFAAAGKIEAQYLKELKFRKEDTQARQTTYTPQKPGPYKAPISTL